MKNAGLRRGKNAAAAARADVLPPAIPSASGPFESVRDRSQTPAAVVLCPRKRAAVHLSTGPGQLQRAPWKGWFLRLKARRGPKRAIIAVAASMLKAAYCMLRDATPYHDLGAAYFDQRDRARALRPSPAGSRRSAIVCRSALQPDRAPERVGFLRRTGCPPPR